MSGNSQEKNINYRERNEEMLSLTFLFQIFKSQQEVSFKNNQMQIF